MTPSLDGINAKVRRAEHHLKALEASIRAFVEAGLLITSEQDLPNQGYNVVYSGMTTGFPVDWGTMLGDFLHNTRSVLDHLVWQLALSNGAQPDRHNRFPVHATEDGFKSDVLNPGSKHVSPLHGLDPDAIARIEARQPYVGRTKADAEETPLYLLHRCWNMDKHQLIHAVQLYVASDVLKVSLEPEFFRLERVEMFVLPGNLLNPGDKLAFIQAMAPTSTPSGTTLKMKFDIPVSVAFGRPGEMPTVTFKHVRDMFADVTSVVLEFAPMFE